MSGVPERLRNQARMVADGSMTLSQAYVSYMSFRGSLEKRRGDGRARFRMDVHWIVRDFDRMFAELFMGAARSHATDTIAAHHPTDERSPYGH